MKTYTIGRQEDCDIVIYDPTQMVSRHHAVLTVNGTKMTITDQSSNGTYINGIKIAAGAPVPVTRKDVVSFAQAAELNWGRIPDPSKKIFWWVLAAVAILAIVGAILYFGDQKHKKIVDDGKAKWVQDSTLRVEQTKKLDTLLTDCAFFEAKCDSLTKATQALQDKMNKKQSSNELKEAIKQLAKVETDIQSIKYKELLAKVNMANGQSAANGIDRKEFQKTIDELCQTAANYKGTIKRVENTLKEIEKKVAGIKDAQTPKPTKTDKDKDKKPETNPNDKPATF